MHLHTYGPLLPLAVLWASYFTSVLAALANDRLPDPQRTPKQISGMPHSLYLKSYTLDFTKICQADFT